MSLSEEKSLTIDDVVNKIVSKVNLKLALVFGSAVIPASMVPATIFITVFTGMIPYTEWVCVSDKCHALFQGHNGTEFHSEATMCGHGLVAGEDFNWTSTRDSFSQDWGIYCETEAKLSIASSFFFIGACLGLLGSTAVFDRLGRKNGAVFGNVISVVATLVGIWVPNYEALLAVRIFQGVGQFINLTGLYCWVVEFAPHYLRHHISAYVLVSWSGGYILLVGLAYLIQTWRYVFLGLAICNVLVITPLVLYPISPRFALIRGREEEAKKTLEAFSRVADNPLDLSQVELIYETRVQNYWEQVQDFKRYPVMMKRTLLSMLGWFTVAILFYGFDFGWSKLTNALYVTYLLAAVGKTFAYTITIPACAYIGRRGAMMFFTGLCLASIFCAMIDLNFGGFVTMEYLANLTGSIGCSSAFCVIYLFTSELSPTSHRGMIMSLSSSSARVGSFIGPYVSLLYGVMDRRVPLGIMAGVSVVLGVSMWFQPETGGMIPETPADLREEGEGNPKGNWVKQEDEDDL